MLWQASLPKAVCECREALECGGLTPLFRFGQGVMNVLQRTGGEVRKRARDAQRHLHLLLPQRQGGAEPPHSKGSRHAPRGFARSHHFTAATALVFAVASSLCARAIAQSEPTTPAAAAAPAQPTTPAPATESQPDTKTPEAPKQDENPKPADNEKPAPAQTAPARPEPDLMGGSGNGGPSKNVVINLINRLVKKGHLDKEEAAELIAQAEQDAVTARLQTRDDAQLVTQMVIQQAVQQKVIPGIDHIPEDEMRVTYIPETVKKQIRDDLRQDVMTAAKAQNWAGPKGLPEWVTKFRVKGDIRIRYENDFLPEGNDNTGAFPNFNAINTGVPFDVAGTEFSPQLNTDQDRTRVRLRVRASAEVDLGEGFTAGMRLATGATNTPVSANQSLGFAGNQQGGNFSKYAIWLDRGFIKYELGEDPNRRLTAAVGRLDNPFFGGNDVVWDDDLGFDGIMVSGRYQLTPKLTTFGTVGAFPVFNSDLNFASNQPAKFKSSDKYLYGAQIGVDLKPAKNFQAKIAAAYYYFDGISGKLSTPFTPLTVLDQGDTDETRPMFSQKGNTYMALRDIVADASNDFGTINQFQYFGLASKFRPLVLSGRLDYNGFEPVQVSLIGDYVKNLAWNGNDIESKAVNNRGPTSAGNSTGAYAGGDTAWMLTLRAGNAAMEKRGHWQAGASYRYLESDAVVDGFSDSVFGFGGTNMKGPTLWGTLATSEKTWLTFRWLSATEIAGPPLRSDIFLIDFTGRF